MADEQEQRWKRVADAVKDRLDQMVLTQKEFADLSGVGQDTLGKIINAKQYSYRPNTLKKIARALGWPPDALHRIAAGEDPETFREATMASEDAAGYDSRISRLDPEDVRYVDAVIEAAERRKGYR